MTVWSPGQQNPSVQSARYQVRKQIRDGLPELDATPVPFEMVRLESLSDQVTTGVSQTVFQLRFQNVPLEQFATVNAIPGTLVAFIDNSWVPTYPTVDVDQNGNFTLPSSPAQSLLVTYGWQFFSDSDIDNFVDEARQWLREFATVALVPDGLNPALIHWAASLALGALARQVTLSAIRGGDADIDLSKLTEAYSKQAADLNTLACSEREAYYSRGSESTDPTVVSVSSVGFRDWSPRR